MNTIKYAILFLLLFTQLALATETSKRVAMLISSNGTAATPELSYDLEELAQAYLVLHDNGIALDIVSPKGGAVLVKTNKDNLDYIQRFKSLALHKLQNSLAASEAKATDYDGVFIVGGGGAMIDLPQHAQTQRFLTHFAQSDAVITAVCHGPAAIANLKVNGEFFVKGKRVNSFTHAEEQAFNAELLDAFPFLNEQQLQKNGATFVSNAPMLPYIAVDGNLITAQNPMSVPKAAEAMVLKLGLALNKRQLFKDEATMELIAKARNSGASIIDIAQATHADKYDINYLALYGLYAHRLASDADKANELTIMETISHYFHHPMYESALIHALVEHGHIDKAKARFEQFKENYPENESIEALRVLVGA